MKRMAEHLLNEEMTTGFNKVLAEHNSILTVEFKGSCGYVKFIADKFNGENCTPYVTDEFYEILNDYLKNYHNINNQVSVNNTRSTFWVIG